MRPTVRLEGKDERNGLSLSLSLRPPHSAEFINLVGEVRALRLIINPNLLSDLARFFVVPPSHWAAAKKLQAKLRNTNLFDYGGGTSLVHALRDAVKGKGARPFKVSIKVHAPQLLLLEPPPLSGAPGGSPNGSPLGGNPLLGKARAATSASGPAALSLKILMVRPGAISFATAGDEDSELPSTRGNNWFLGGGSPVVIRRDRAMLEESPSELQLSLEIKNTCIALLPAVDLSDPRVFTSDVEGSMLAYLRKVRLQLQLGCWSQ